MSQSQTSGVSRCKHCGQFRNWMDEHMCPPRTKDLPLSFSKEYAEAQTSYRFLKVFEKRSQKLVKKWKKPQILQKH